MPVRLRLARHGHKKAPVYHIVAINSKRPREGKPLELLGKYDPIPRVPLPSTSSTGSGSGSSRAAGGGGGVTILPPAANVFGSDPNLVQEKKQKTIEWNVERIRYWLGVGAEPTRTVVKLLEKGGVLTTPHKWQHAWSPPPPPTTSTLPSTSASTSASASS